jgi:hypothetical protein
MLQIESGCDAVTSRRVVPELAFEENRYLQTCPAGFSPHCGENFFILENFDHVQAVTQLPDEEVALNIYAVPPVAMRSAPGWVTPVG